ncbi:glutamine-hydrolyzing carbamoyl-phosphate synthase small subunit [Bacillaceae bacterium S4-13-58]
MQTRWLVLEDGTIFKGKAFGADTDQWGEVVFNTGMTGYQEILTDPSYCGQILTMTYPLIGNYGINHDDFESIEPAIHGLIVKEAAVYPSNWRSTETIDEYLKKKNIPGVYGVDTRKLTRLIRNSGTLRGAVTRNEVEIPSIIEELNRKERPKDLVKRVSIQKPYVIPDRGHRVVLVDFGAKHGILRELTKRGCHITVVPYNTTAEEILQLKPDGVLLSNGPGDPTDVIGATQTIQHLFGKLPIFGICLGHQLFALACGATTSKLTFGHRGSNHPVIELSTGRIDITAQNHGYTVDLDSLNNTQLELTHQSINDGTVEGLSHKLYPAFSVQYHPEASPGPEDSNPLFEKFITLISNAREKKGDIIHA